MLGVGFNYGTGAYNTLVVFRFVQRWILNGNAIFLLLKLGFSQSYLPGGVLPHGGHGLDNQTSAIVKS